MKKVLFGATALLATSAFSANANAAEPLKLQLGGYMDWYVAAVDQDDTVLNGDVARTATEVNTFDVVGDGEIHFLGETTLDNGIKVGVQVELEGGNRSGGDPVDESFVTVDTSYGRVMMGSTDNVGVLMHASAPDVGRLGMEESVAHELFVRPATGGNETGGNDYVDYLDATWINTDGDANKISYITPTMYGMTLGATYVAGGPLTGDEGVTGQQMEQQNFEEGYVLAGMYSSEFSGVGVTMTGAYAMYNVGSNGYRADGTAVVPGNEADNTDQDVRTEWTAGTNLTYGGLTFGGAFRHVDMPTGTDNGVTGINQDGYAWNAGVSYEAGPYGVSLAYMKSEVEGTNAQGAVNSAFQNDDKAELYMLSGKYNLGAGVDTFASLAYVDYEDEVGNNVDASNVKDGVTKDADGWAFVTGVALAF